MQQPHPAGQLSAQHLLQSSHISLLNICCLQSYDGWRLPLPGHSEAAADSEVKACLAPEAVDVFRCKAASARLCENSLATCRHDWARTARFGLAGFTLHVRHGTAASAEGAQQRQNLSLSLFAQGPFFKWAYSWLDRSFGAQATLQKVCCIRGITVGLFAVMQYETCFRKPHTLMLM